VHLISWPAFNEKEIDDVLEKEFGEALSSVEILLNIRAKENIKIRWPLKQAYVPKPLRKSMLEMIGFLSNIKEVKTANKPVKGLVGQDNVYLDKEVTMQLKNEALLSELSRAIQEFRKQKKFNVGDAKKIAIKTNNDELIKLIKENTDSLKEMTDSILTIKNQQAGQIVLNSWGEKYELSLE
jgi:valyl-tRNA synthetase